MCSDRMSYEPELFPALLLAKWPTARVTLFQNGKGIVTGVRHPRHAMDVIFEVLTALKDRIRVSRGDSDVDIR